MPGMTSPTSHCKNWLSLVLGLALGLLAACLITINTPKVHESEAIVELQPHHMDHSSSNACTTGQRVITPFFFEQELRLLRSHAFLSIVAGTLQLPKRWSMNNEQTYQTLKESMTFEQVPKKDMLSFRVRSQNRKEAIEIAQEAVSVYGELWKERDHETYEREISELKKAVQKQEDIVEECRKRFAAIEKFGQNKLSKKELAEYYYTCGLSKQDVTDAKRDFETEQELLNALKIKLVGTAMDSKTPKEFIKIHEQPAEHTKLASPIWPLNLALGAVAGLAVGAVLPKFKILPLV